LKTGARAFVVDKPRMQNFNRHGPIHEQVPRTIHRAHTAFAETFLKKILFVEGPICE
jgi:hypothetical protein